MHIIGDCDVEFAVAVIVDEGATRTPFLAGAGGSGLRRDLFKGSVALVVIKAVMAVSGDIEIVVAVVVVVADANALPPARVRKSGLDGDIGEGSVVIVMK